MVSESVTRWSIISISTELKVLSGNGTSISQHVINLRRKGCSPFVYFRFGYGGYSTNSMTISILRNNESKTVQSTLEVFGFDKVPKLVIREYKWEDYYSCRAGNFCLFTVVYEKNQALPGVIIASKH